MVGEVASLQLASMREERTMSPKIIEVFIMKVSKNRYKIGMMTCYGSIKEKVKK